LNPKKSTIRVYERNLPRKIVSKEGIEIDPTIIEEIQQIPLHRRKKLVQPPFDKIIFIKRYMLNFVEITKSI